MNKSNTQLLSREDYELYKIPLPFSSLKKKTRNKMILMELGKLHPCFSDDCSFESRISLGKKGLTADVIVMSRFCLEKYKTDFPGKKLRAENFPKKSLFKESRKDSVKNGIKIGLILALIFAIAGLGYFSSYLSKVKAAKKNEKNSWILKNEMEEEKKPGKTFSYTNLIEEIFKTAEMNKGKLNNFVWKQDGFKESFSFFVKGAYPEKFYSLPAEFNFSSLNFQNETPEFSLNGTAKIIPNPDGISKINENPEKMTADDSLFRMVLREKIKNCGGKIIEESVTPFGITFEADIQEETENAAVIKEIKNLICEKQIEIKEFSLYAEKSGTYKISFVFGKTGFNHSGEILEALEKYKTLFALEKPAKSQKQDLLWKSDGEKNLKLKSGKKDGVLDTSGKIGCVIHADGSVNSFYKDQSGKIEIIRN